MRRGWASVMVLGLLVLGCRRESHDAEALDGAIADYDGGAYSAAIPVIRSHAQDGEAIGQFYLGLSYNNGQGVSQDYREAVKWYRLAAEQGVKEAQNNLGRLYYEGLGVPQDHREAVKWYRLAADQGNATAQNNLGTMYSEGTGVLQDYREALRWYRKAAAQRNANAMANIGAMYSNGTHVPQDYVRAHMWANLAVAEGLGSTWERDKYARWLSPRQLETARSLATECQSSNYQQCGESRDGAPVEAQLEAPSYPDDALEANAADMAASPTDAMGHFR
jgi:hypothetical protein